MTDQHKQIDKLIKELNEARTAYYNGADPGMSDKQYDEKLSLLESLENAEGYHPSESPVNAVGAAPTGRLSKVTHEFPALSLAKTKSPEEISAEFPGETVIMWKLDGSTCQVTYEGGLLALAATRGDGEVGQDITVNAPYLHGLPQEIPYTGKLVVRGETLMSYEEFDRLNESLPEEERFANPRNLANATVTALDNHILSERKVDFCAFSLVYADDLPDTFTERFELLERCGIATVPYEKVAKGGLISKIEEWGERVSSYTYPVDGLVIADQDAAYSDTLPGTGHHPNVRRGYAFKWADETAQTTLREIEWSPSRTGLLNPVAIFDSVELEGTTVSRATLHNLSFIIKKNLVTGDDITVYKANKIIPAVDENLTEHDPIDESAFEGIDCPACSKPSSVHRDPESDTLVLRCENPDCPAKHIGRFVHFVSRECMNIDGISEKTITKLVGAGFLRSFDDFYGLEKHSEEMASWDGFGPKAVSNLLSALEASRHEVSFARLINAYGISNVGKVQSALLAAHFGDNIDNLLDIKPPFDFTEIDGFGEVISASLNEWLDRYSPSGSHTDSELTDLLSYLEMREPQVQNTGDKPLDGLTFVVTGSVEHFANRDEVHAFIEEHGGHATGSVSKKTSYLVNNDLTSTSGKNKKAKELGIPIISEAQLLEMV
ncbi:MAG: NAD-dependent DNA ligase LigA [Eubacterium sp.]|nr:NAD-dependent DNA ligase LigA [Eubacterium sp.]